ncbi:MAG: hypothetical protein IT285_05700 [Bdellovibrionales bacterium]|nr:hypothetical protein [Bdellovibrionales bacterium]
MIYVSQDQLDQVEYLIRQSIQGNHVLFDSDTVRDVFLSLRSDASGFAVQDAYGVEHHIERLISQPSLAQKRAYLERLDRDTYRKVVRTYFNIVENNLFESGEARH